MTQNQPYWRLPLIHTSGKVPLHATHLFFLFIFVMTISPNFSQADSIFELVDKIKVDSAGAAGASDGNAFSNAGDIVAVSDNKGNTKLYNVNNGNNIGQVRHNPNAEPGPDGETNAIHFSPDDTYFVTGMNNLGAKVWRTADGELIRHLANGTSTDGAAFSPNGQWLAIAETDKVAIYTVPGFERKREFSLMWNPLAAIANEVNSIDWTSDSSHLVYGGAGHTVRVVSTGEDISDWEIVHSIRHPSITVKSVRFSPDGAMIAASGSGTISGRRVVVYRTSDAKILARPAHESSGEVQPGDDDDSFLFIDNINIEAVEWSNDSQYLFTGGLYSGILRAWRVDDWSMVGWTQGQEWQRQIEYLSVNNDNLIAASGDEGYLYLLSFTPLPEKSRIKAIDHSTYMNNIAVETEDFDANVSQGDNYWEVIADGNASGDLSVKALPNDGVDKKRAYGEGDPWEDSPKLDYRLDVPTTGTYYIWAKAKAASWQDNTFHIGVNGQPSSTSKSINVATSSSLTWRSVGHLGLRPFIYLPAGESTLNLWMREDGVVIDKIMLTKSAAHLPLSFWDVIPPNR